jgi:hypothetical protein
VERETKGGRGGQEIGGERRKRSRIRTGKKLKSNNGKRKEKED